MLCASSTSVYEQLSFFAILVTIPIPKKVTIKHFLIISCNFPLIMSTTKNLEAQNNVIVN